MAIQLHFEHSDPMTLTDTLRGIDTYNDVASLFEGDCFLNGTFIDTVDPEGEAERIISATWVDTDPPNSFHEFVLAYMNNTDIHQIVNVAEGNSDSHKYMEAISNYYHGFEEAVNELINLEGLEFVFGNDFNLCTLFDLVVREIIKEYLREHELEP